MVVGSFCSIQHACYMPGGWCSILHVSGIVLVTVVNTAAFEQKHLPALLLP